MFSKVISIFHLATLDGAVFRLFRYLQNMLTIKFFADKSNLLKDIAIYVKIRNGGQVVYPMMTKSTILTTVQKLIAKTAISHDP